MTQVVLLSHGGVACALPAAQVVGGLGADVPSIELFGREETQPRRTLVVETPVGRRVVWCEEARFDELDPDAMQPVPPLIASRLNLPHVVGLSGEAGDLRWLVDLARWEEP
ncbi:MAG: hypothetical protein H6719_28745 [Sandaracinaceae bacterium]|nr:hypothetical protein [Sandaracinaceae bacterium]